MMSRSVTLAACALVLVSPAMAQSPPQTKSQLGTPVVQPHGETRTTAPAHAKPAAKPASPKAPPVKSAAKPAPATAPAVVPPAPPAVPPAPAEPAKGTKTGLPLPRWGSLRTDDVNLRAGPGPQYPILWVYKRRDLPVRIEREFDNWRLVQEQDGTKGWVNAATLVGRRSLLVTGAEHVLRAAGRDDAASVARLKPGVVGRLRACEATAEWCEVQVGDYRGWLRRTDFWGISAGEAVQN